MTQRRRPTAPRRGRVWVPFHSTAAAVLQEGVQLLVNSDLLFLYFGQTGREIPAGTTVVRIRGSYRIDPNSVGNKGQLTLAIVPMRQGGVYGEDIRDDLVRPLWRDDYAYYGGAVETGAGVFEPWSTTREIDAHAMRTLPENGMQLHMIGHADVVDGDEATSVQVMGAVLIFLP